MDTLPAVNSPTVTGLDLKLRRTAARVTQRRLAEQTGWKAQYVSQVEARAVVPPATADRYVAALAALATDAA
jgi:transcriptional regulator with XRE-family HTH domain